jgi:hypothetical protein
MSQGELNRALVTAATSWPAMKRDPVWCMRYLELAAAWLHEHRVFTAELPLVYIVNDCGMRQSDALPDDCWCDAFDFLGKLGWIAPIPQTLHGSKQWMSLL